MALSDDKKFLVDGHPVTAKELLQRAKFECGYDGPLVFTSEAAQKLRNAGYTVEDNDGGAKW